MGACVITFSNENFSPIDAAYGFIVSGTLTCSASYATGGDTLTPAQLAAGEIKVLDLGVAAKPASSAAGGVMYRYEPSTGKIMAFWQNPPGISQGPLTEVANGTDLSGYVAAFQANCM